MTVYDRIIQALKAQGIKYRALEHVPVKTCAEAAKIRGTDPEQGAKALVCLADKNPVMVALPCSRRLDFKKFKKSFSVRDFRLASPAEVLALTGLEIGSIPPLGFLFNFSTYADESLFSQEELVFNAGDLTRSVIIKTTDYQKLSQPILNDFSV